MITAVEKGSSKKLSVGANDGDDDADEDDDNNGEANDDNDDKGEECNDENGQNDGMIGSSGLDERVYSPVRALKRKCEIAKIDCGVLVLLVPKKGTDKEMMELSFLCCHNNRGRFHLENCTCLNNCCHRF